MRKRTKTNKDYIVEDDNDNNNDDDSSGNDTEEWSPTSRRRKSAKKNSRAASSRKAERKSISEYDDDEEDDGHKRSSSRRKAPRKKMPKNIPEEYSVETVPVPSSSTQNDPDVRVSLRKLKRKSYAETRHYSNYESSSKSRSRSTRKMDDYDDEKKRKKKRTNDDSSDSDRHCDNNKCDKEYSSTVKRSSSRDKDSRRKEKRKLYEKNNDNNDNESRKKDDKTLKDDDTSKKRRLLRKFGMLSADEYRELNDIITKDHQTDFKDVYKELLKYVKAVLVKKCSSEYCPSGNEKNEKWNVEDYFDMKINLTQQDLWKINSVVRKLSSRNDLEASMNSAIKQFVFRNLTPTFQDPDSDDPANLFGLFIEFLLNSFLVYRRTTILLQKFDSYLRDPESGLDDSVECFKLIKIFFHTLNEFCKYLRETDPEDKEWEVDYLKASICRPLFYFQTRNKNILKLLKSANFFRFEIDNKDQELISQEKDVENFLQNLEKNANFLRNESYLDDIYEKTPAFEYDNDNNKTQVQETSSSPSSSETTINNEFKEPSLPDSSWSMSMKRHLFLMNTVRNKVQNRPNSGGDVISPAEMRIFSQNRRFIWHDSDEPTTWGERIAKKYYDRLFKEYCLIDLSRYVENKFGMRWRIDRDLLIGKGQFVCGEVRCQTTQSLTSWEVLFTYLEHGEKKSTLVKIRLCPECSGKLNYYREHRRIKKAEMMRKTEFERMKQFSYKVEPNNELYQMAADRLATKSDQLVKNISASGQFDCPDMIHRIWDQPIKKEADNDENIEKELDDFLDSIID